VRKRKHKLVWTTPPKENKRPRKWETHLKGERKKKTEGGRPHGGKKGADIESEKSGKGSEKRTF